MNRKVISLTESKSFISTPIKTYIDPEIGKILDELFTDTNLEEQELISKLLSMEAPGLSRDDMLLKVIQSIPELKPLLQKHPIIRSERNRDKLEIQLMIWCEKNMDKLNEENLEQIFYAFKQPITTYTLRIRLMKAGHKDIIPFWVIN